MNQIPRPGEIYRHFKGHLYQVVTVAEHTETGEKLVIYQALYGRYGVFARPLSMFIQEVDQKKYPDADQRYRFEPADPDESGSVSPESGKTDERKVRPSTLQESGDTVVGQEQSGINPLLLSFVEAKDLDVKLEILSAMEGKASQEDMDLVCEALDLPMGQGEVEEQMDAVKKYLQMRRKFDGGRLR